MELVFKQGPYRFKDKNYLDKLVLNLLESHTDKIYNFCVGLMFDNDFLLNLLNLTEGEVPEEIKSIVEDYEYQLRRPLYEDEIELIGLKSLEQKFNFNFSFVQIMRYQRKSFSGTYLETLKPEIEPYASSLKLEHDFYWEVVHSQSIENFLKKPAFIRIESVNNEDNLRQVKNYLEKQLEEKYLIVSFSASLNIADDESLFLSGNVKPNETFIFAL